MSPPRRELTLVVTGKPGHVPGRLIRGWKSLSIRRRLDALVGTFQIEAVDIGLGLAVGPGSPIELYLESDRLLTGHVDGISSTDGPGGSSLTIFGRDKAADVVDSSAPEVPNEFLQRLAPDIVTAIVAAGFPGLEVELDFATRLYGARIPLFRVNPGETAWRAMERALRSRNLLAWSNPAGQIVVGSALGQPGTVKAIAPPGSVAEVDLVWGETPTFSDVAISWTSRERFGVYVVKGQQSGTDLVFGTAASEVEGIATDPELSSRPRKLLITAEKAVTPQDAKDRAAWEASFRAARAATVTAKVVGWRQTEGGPLWAINQLVRVKVATRKLDEELLVNGVTLTESSEGGRTTQLELVRSDAYAANPEVQEEDSPFLNLVEEDD